jgi:nucleoside 2-deoxyribosyltransferase
MSGVALTGEAPAKKRVYVAGPMTGIANLNRGAFNLAAAQMQNNGFEPFNPHDLHPGDVDWEDAMKTDIKALCDCDEVAVLDGWQKSRGASLEVFIANQLGIPVKPISHFL